MRNIAVAVQPTMNRNPFTVNLPMIVLLAVSIIIMTGAATTPLMTALQTGP